jgi:hypothetical protein
MFKRYPDPYHYLLAVPIGRRVWIRVWDQDNAGPFAWHRKHLFLTFLFAYLPPIPGCKIREFRFRIGTHYL